jgi:hypothetical protein
MAMRELEREDRSRAEGDREKRMFVVRREELRQPEEERGVCRDAQRRCDDPFEDRAASLVNPFEHHRSNDDEQQRRE